MDPTRGRWCVADGMFGWRNADLARFQSLTKVKLRTFYDETIQEYSSISIGMGNTIEINMGQQKFLRGTKIVLVAADSVGYAAHSKQDLRASLILLYFIHKF